MHASEQVVRTVVGLWKENRVADARRYFHDDARLIEPESLPYGGVHVGYDAILPVLAQAARCMDTANAAERFWLADEDHVVALFDSPLRLAEGTMQMSVLEHWHVRDGKVDSIQPFYFDTAAFCAALQR